MKGGSLPFIGFEHKRDAYGFAVRPQHLQTYREYAKIYEEEEEERSERWKRFLDRKAESAQMLSDESSAKAEASTLPKSDHEQSILEQCDRPDSEEMESENETMEEERTLKSQMWAQIRPSLLAIEEMMSFRVKKRKIPSRANEHDAKKSGALAPIKEARILKGGFEEESEEEFYDVERSDPAQELPTTDCGNAGSVETVDPTTNVANNESFFSLKEELECLVHGGVPMALRGELWQAFVGVRTRRVEGYYHDLLAREVKSDNNNDFDVSVSSDTDNAPKRPHGGAPEKWKGQIEKDLPRTFPGHPALDEDGRNALRRLLTAYARHNPSVGYCQAMNFFAGLLLLLMPEENAFWTLLGIIDDYFDNYFSEEMIESQVDQFVFEELIRERFPKLINHLDYLGVQVAWVTGPWFLSIFVNMLPWESVLRVWDVLLFDGNRVILFRTALALIELYGPALVTTKDAGDAVTLLQSLTGSTFDSSQLVLTACMGFQAVNEIRLQEIRRKHRSAVIDAMEERCRGLRICSDSQGIASKLYSFKHDPGSLLPKNDSAEGFSNPAADAGLDSKTDIKEQVTWLKIELCRLLEEKRSSILRAEELETALMEMVKQDNRRILSANVEQLEQEVCELQQALAEKQEQEHAMLQVLMKVEHEQKVAEDARLQAEQEAAAQRYSARVFQEKYEEATNLLAQMEKRAVMAETMLEATLQYQSSQAKAQQPPSSPRTLLANQESFQDVPTRKVGLLSRPFGLGWLDKNKGKPGNTEYLSEGKPSNDEAHGGVAPTQEHVNEQIEPKE